MPDAGRYLVTARKYRPQTFDDLVAQEHVTQALRNAVVLGRLAQAYLFSGPRGVGKTTAARLLAKAINCQTDLAERENAEPCRQCDACRAFEEGRSLNVIEIDAASNNKVDDVRDLRETVRIPPQGAKKKVYILDEVHMLSTSAFNALLKTLEEPPPHVLFIFATTEPHKVLPTILSRCQRFDFRRIQLTEIVHRLREICGWENVQTDDESLMLIARKADGALRDALSTFDQAVSLVGDDLQYEALRDALGVVDEELFYETMRLVAGRDRAGLLHVVDGLLRRGYDLAEYLGGLAEHVRHLLVVKATGSAELVEATDAARGRLAASAEPFAEADLLRLLMLVDEAEGGMKEARQPRLKLELSLLKMAALEPAADLRRLMAKLERIEQALATGTLPPPSPDASAPRPAPPPTPAQAATPPAPRPTASQTASITPAPARLATRPQPAAPVPRAEAAPAPAAPAVPTSTATPAAPPASDEPEANPPTPTSTVSEPVAAPSGSPAPPPSALGASAPETEPLKPPASLPPSAAPPAPPANVLPAAVAPAAVAPDPEPSPEPSRVASQEPKPPSAPDAFGPPPGRFDDVGPVEEEWAGGDDEDRWSGDFPPAPDGDGPALPPSPKPRPPATPARSAPEAASEPTPDPASVPGADLVGDLFGAPALKPRKPQNTAAQTPALSGDGAAGEPPAPGAPVDPHFGVPLHRVKEAWPALCAQGRPSLRGILRLTEPTGVRLGAVEVAVPDAFSQTTLQSEADALSERLGALIGEEAPSLRFVVRRKGQKGPEPAAAVDPFEHVKRLRQEHPVIRALFERFGAEIKW